MKKALVYYLYGTKNAGDMAICCGAIEVLKRQQYHITMVSRFSEHENEYEISKSYIHSYYPDVRVIPGPFSFERDFSAIHKLKAYGSSFTKVCGLQKDKKTKALIEESDVVFFNGGNLLRGDSLKDYLRLIALFYPIQLAYNARKPVYCLPQSTAGISHIGKKLLNKYLHYFSKIYIREKQSLRYLRKVFPDIVFEYCTDLAFFCRDSEQAKKNFREKYGDLTYAGKIALVIRNTGIGDIGNIKKKQEDKLLRILHSYIEKHPNKEYWIMIQTLKDREISHQFAASFGDHIQTRIIEEHDPLVLRELYKHMEFMITMRLHAGILTLSANVPVIGLFCTDWGLKNPGIMEAFGMPFLLTDQQEGTVENLISQLPENATEVIAAKISRFQDVLVINN